MTERSSGSAPLAARVVASAAARAAVCVGLTSVTLGSLARAAQAQAACPESLAEDSSATPRPVPPLDRVVPGARSGAPVPLRTALDQLAAEAGVRLSYSRELLPLDRLSCPASARTSLGSALARLLQGTGVQPVGVGGNQVVLAPALAPASPGALATSPRLAVLEQVVVTGSATGAPSRRLPYTLDVVDGETFGLAAGAGAAGLAESPLAGALNGRVPGLWLWAQPPTAVLARYGSLRGASSFGVSTPKLYLDGVEVANPLVVTDLPGDRIASVEVIRGPQGAALYGADAISGVINVVTRHDGARNTSASGRTLYARGGVGGAGSDYAGRPAVAQDYALTLRTGTAGHTAGASFSATSLGAYAPGAASRRVTATADLRRVEAAGTVSATLRLADAATNSDTLLRIIGGTVLPRQRLQQLTAGVTLTRTAGTRWTHAVTAGVDGYRLSGVATEFSAIPIPLDTAQRAARGGAARTTLRASSTGTFDLRPGVRAIVLGMADYGLLRDATASGDSVLRERDDPNEPGGPQYATGTAAHTPTALSPVGRSVGMSGGRRDRGSPLSLAGDQVAYLGTAGVVGQATLVLRDAVFLTAGLRGERNDGFTRASRFAALPSLGAAVVRSAGPGTTVKLRAAYGSGIRPARTATHATAWRVHSFGGDLRPETQRGLEAGADLFVDVRRAAGGSWSPGTLTYALHGTVFNQLATDLLQQVNVTPDAPWVAPPPGAPLTYGPRYLPSVVQNVGAVRNRGVELAGDVRAGPLTLAATYALVDSRVRTLAAGYTGDLRAGDRMLQVPRHTAGLTAAWQQRGWTASLGAARAANWINYDRAALAANAALVGSVPDDRFLGAALREYWRRYPGVTRLEASAARDLRRGFTVVLTGANLLDQQENEPDNVTLVPGRTLTLGVRARF